MYPSRRPKRRPFLGLVLALGVAPSLSAWARSVNEKPVYDPEVALLLLTLQKQSIPLLAQELKRQAALQNLAAVQILVQHTVDQAARELEATLDPDSDVLEGFGNALIRYHAADTAVIQQLIGELRRYHDLKAGSFLEKLDPPRSRRSPRILAVSGVGPDVEKYMDAAPLLKEPAASARRRPLLSERRWNIDFYMGDFNDLWSYYRRKGYRVFYRLRAPLISTSKQTYVLAPEEGLRPRLVYCGFFGRDYFWHVRAQYSLLTPPSDQGATVRTLYCPKCKWTLPGVRALKSLISTMPHGIENAVLGYTGRMDDTLAASRIGAYENDYWLIACYDLPAGLTATVACRHSCFGDISAEAAEVLAKSGAARIFYGGPAAALDGAVPANSLYVPQNLLDRNGKPVAFSNAFPPRREHSGLHQGIPSPFFMTSDRLASARAQGVETVDCAAARIAERLMRFNGQRAAPVALGLALITTNLENLQADAESSVYSGWKSTAGSENATRTYVASLLRFLRTPKTKTP